MERFEAFDVELLGHAVEVDAVGEVPGGRLGDLFTVGLDFLEG